MEPLIVVLVFISALLLGGNASNRAPMNAVNDETNTAPAENNTGSRPSCGDQGRIQRDLSVPHADQNRPDVKNISVKLMSGACDV